MKKDIMKLSNLIVDKINKKIEILERCFRRRLREKHHQPKISSQIRSVSIDLAGNENMDPNLLLQDNLEKLGPEKKGMVQKGKVNCSIDNKLVEIDVKKNDDPVQLAKRILLQRGLGLSYLDTLSENISNFQRRIFG